MFCFFVHLYLLHYNETACSADIVFTQFSLAANGPSLRSLLI